jgi:hypothetical protein
MAQQQQNITLAAPGFMGVNTQDSPITQAPEFCAVADNCIIDRYGRIGARKGHSVLTSTKTALGSATITAVHEFVAHDGTKVVFSTGNNKIFSGVGTLVDITPASFTVTADDWQIVTLNDYCYFFQSAHEPLAYKHSSTTLDEISAVAGYNGTAPEANTVISAYGRLWAADIVANKYTVYWTDLLIGHAWAGTSGGSIDITDVWPNGDDEIVALAAHNNYLLIFGRESIIVYGSSHASGKITDPATDLVLLDVVSGIGCAARKSIQSVGSDLLFLDRSGVRSFARVIQEKSLPIGDISKNVRADIKDIVAAETGTIYSIFSPDEAFYLLGFPSSTTVYCFDMRGFLEDGSARATTWSGVDFSSATELQDGSAYFGNTDGICKYTGYLDDAATYRMRYYSNPLTFGQASTVKIPKQIDITLIGGGGDVALYWGYDYSGNFRSQSISISSGTEAEYGIAEYGAAPDPPTPWEYGSSSTFKKQVNLSGHGTSVTIGFESDVNNSALSIQEMNIQALLGRIR